MDDTLLSTYLGQKCGRSVNSRAACLCRRWRGLQSGGERCATKIRPIGFSILCPYCSYITWLDISSEENKEQQCCSHTLFCTVLLVANFMQTDFLHLLTNWEIQQKSRLLFSPLEGAQALQFNPASPKSLYLFPVAAVTNCHKLSSLNQHKFTLLQFWRSEIGLCGCVFSGDCEGESVLCLVQLLDAAHIL